MIALKSYLLVSLPYASIFFMNLLYMMLGLILIRHAGVLWVVDRTVSCLLQGADGHMITMFMNSFYMMLGMILIRHAGLLWVVDSAASRPLAVRLWIHVAWKAFRRHGHGCSRVGFRMVSVRHLSHSYRKVLRQFDGNLSRFATDYE